MVSAAKIRMSYYKRDKEHAHEKIGILPWGGDCPGLNAVTVMSSGARTASAMTYSESRTAGPGSITGRRALNGLPRHRHLSSRRTILGTSRTNPYKKAESLQQLKANWQKFGLNYMVAVDVRIRSASPRRLKKGRITPSSVRRKPLITISRAQITPSASTLPFKSLSKRSTGCIPWQNHIKRVMVVEVMGRHTGWIATIPAGRRRPLHPYS